jgi:heterogeneous nuclear rnp K-like protein 2
MQAAEKTPDLEKSTGGKTSFPSLRALLTSKEAGIIIGKGGKNVLEIKESSGAKIRVSEVVTGLNERVVTVSGSVDSIAKSFSMFFKRLLSESDNSRNRPVSLTILIPHTRMGAIIGKGGSKIKEIQSNSGAKVSASELLLPNSTERALNISGTPESVDLAINSVLELIGEFLLSDYSRGSSIILYKPSLDYSYNFKNSRQGQAINNRRPKKENTKINEPNEEATFSIPDKMVGAIIGKNGRNINEIREASGSRIKVMPPTVGTERTVLVTGSESSNKKALSMLLSRLEDEKKKSEEENN